jgi:hypothetical protein
MAKRRSYRRTEAASTGPAVDPDVARFASLMRAEERREREAKAAARQERRRADEHARLERAKDEAAAEVKRLRGSSRATAAERAAADEAYKAALAALVAAETGEAPAWAPGDPVGAVEADAGPGPDPGDESPVEG